MLIPEAARQAVHQPHRAIGEFIVGRLRHQPVEAAVEPHEGDIVGCFRGLAHALRQFGEFGAFGRRGAFAGGARHQAFELAAHFDQAQLGAQIDLRDQYAAAGQDHHQPFAGQALQGFADRGAADFQTRRQQLLREHGAGRQLQSDDQLLDQLIGAIGHRLVGDFVGVGGGAGHRGWYTAPKEDWQQGLAIKNICLTY